MAILKKIGKYLATGLAGLYMFNAAPVKADNKPEIEKTYVKKPKLEANLGLSMDGLENKLEKNSPFSNFQVLKKSNKKPVFPKKKSEDIDWQNYFLNIPFNAATGFVTTVLSHELGHAFVAKLMGCRDIKMHGPDIKAGNVASVSYLYPEEGLDNYSENLILTHGTGTTSFLSDVLYQGLKKDQVPDALKQFTATTSLIMLLDRPRYILSTAIKHFSGTEITPSNDFHQIMTNSFDKRLGRNELLEEGFVGIKDGMLYRNNQDGNLEPVRFYADREGKFREKLKKYGLDNADDGQDSKKLEKKLDIAYGIAMGASLLELGLKWKRISYLTQTALGMDAKAPEGYDVFHGGFYPLPEGGFMVSVDGTW